MGVHKCLLPTSLRNNATHRAWVFFLMEYFLSNSMAKKKKKKSIIFQHKLEEKVELHGKHRDQKM
jgi:hypothetical protein